ncbi:MAG: hypothetical protein ACLUGT_09235, partial [Lactobacillaceae bacterium]
QRTPAIAGVFFGALLYNSKVIKKERVNASGLATACQLLRSDSQRLIGTSKLMTQAVHELMHAFSRRIFNGCLRVCE